MPSRSSHNSGRGRGRGYSSGGRGNRLCTHCGRTNHTIETCFIKHVYPPGFQHHVGSAPISSSSFASTSTNGSSASLSTIQKQYTQILQLLQQSNLQSHSPSSVNSLFATNFVSHTSPPPSSGNNLSKPQGDNNSQWWIIDTGATDHITHIFDSYFSTYHIAPKSMTMPNGDTVTTTIAGSVLLYDSLVLHNVYYFPSFHVNIISVTTLFDSTLYDVKLFPNCCKIVQLHHPKMIGFIARRIGKFINPNTNTIDTFDILTDIPPSLTSPNEPTSPPSLHNLPPPTHDITSSPSPHQLPPSPYDIISPTSPPVPTRKSNRLTKPPAYLSEYHYNLLSSMLPASNPGVKWKYFTRILLGYFLSEVTIGGWILWQGKFSSSSWTFIWRHDSRVMVCYKIVEWPAAATGLELLHNGLPCSEFMHSIGLPCCL
ncbi:hypothetical protein KIW84_023092 [Lathyrus oleraceus]|uniref:Retrovirus-related Pol polyprotein from transposon TNT 1-94-like beta-barrel domain-containing protein n=1 Tax=Pisum sativum TaxID=3888 RepID=A0A9D5BAU9_PEA|nr:hypothetical protein KIW84_023092 [Pisum sativum]